MVQTNRSPERARSWPAILVLACLAGPALAQDNGGPIDIGSRRELMVDDYLIERMSPELRQVLHHPVPREIVLVHDRPWEGSGSGYHSVFKDGGLYRMYYKGWQLTVKGKKLTLPHKLVACYAESKDGVHWTKPELGIVEFDGSKQNNIVMASGKIGGVEADPGHVAVFKDENPDCPPEARYKAIVRSPKPNGLLPFRSPDGLHWSPMSDKPVITKGAFDSQNLAFWDPVRKEYRAYFRYFTGGRRDILTATSKDFLNWSEPVPLRYPGAAAEHLYTNQVKPYHRAPHLLVGFPTRYTDRGWTESAKALPNLGHRRLRAAAEPRFGTALTEGLLMTSRDGVTFRRWGEAFLRPGPERPESWAYGDNYIAWHAVETPPTLEGAPNELSIYAGEGYWTGTSCRLRRYTLRLDGFVSLQAPWKGGEMVTKPLTFEGKTLELNFSTSAAGGIRVEVRDADDRPIDGFTLEQCNEVYGDSVERKVSWSGGKDLGALAGKPVRLRFVMKDADLYSFRFAP
ncbi:MAG TPA: hypothetical protein VIL46_13190 [Gemmataceae bacterium]